MRRRDGAGRVSAPAAPDEPRVTRRAPDPGPVSVRRLVGGLTGRTPGGPLVFGDERALAFLGGLSRRLLRVGRPELTALGYFLRPARLRAGLAAAAPGPGRLRMPRGLVFQVPPGNVPTLFGYSWAMALLAGNPSVVRLSSRSGPVAEALLREIGLALADAPPAVARTQSLVGYAPDPAVTRALSAACATRVLWGSDRTVAALRAEPLPPDARELVFGDRSSIALFSAAGWAAASERARTRAVEDFHADTYWYGQAACASPRTVLWVGSEPVATAGWRDFLARLARLLDDREPAVDTATAVETRIASYGLAATGDATRLRFHRPGLTSVRLAARRPPPRRWLGTGTFAHTRLARLDDLVPLLDRHTQTVTHFGFPPADLTGLAHRLGGRSFDRIVPMGAALEFDTVWDGHDLLAEFSRLVTVR
ncbi:acyl-CoA reductase [Streptomyces sp. DSM 44915]|uniref:Acyl-CoA reductase n=1 Tax=Streptomyces chisholmiae TaxID=3075540 RepID=A0ABU2JNL9_9ACTN|nr:acyl-CoA reductase [Streptomyces sp. DSM 44915]MDT0266591.1 acyl-CoA reductase [Streptomyces sp. DSM 44915]